MLKNTPFGVLYLSETNVKFEKAVDKAEMIFSESIRKGL